MIHLPALISDLALILVTAAIVTLLFRKWNQPVVLGYLLAGILVGPHFKILPTVRDVESIKIWAEIGVIFLLFSLGLEFSFKKLSSVGRGASLTAAIEVLFMLLVGFSVGQMLGWSKMDSLFLGGILCISSTTIILRAFEELNLKKTGFAKIVFGVLVVEDLVAILLLVFLSTFALTQTVSGPELAFSSLKLGFFLIVWFLAGIFLIPTLLRWAKPLMSSETLLVLSLGLCLLMVVIATQAGFSAALGAFVMGSLLSETVEGERLEELIMPVRNFFAAVFFVSVGMLIDPFVLKDQWFAVVLISFVTVVGKIISSTSGALLSGYSLKTSIQTGFSLAQIGEFSFIIASLGLTLGVVSPFLYPVAVSVSVITTFATPYLIKWSDPFAEALHFKARTLSPGLGAWLDRLEVSSTANVQSLQKNESANWVFRILLNSVIVIALTLGVETFFPDLLRNIFPGNDMTNVISFWTALIVSLPFLWGIVHGSILEFSGVKSFQDLKKATSLSVLGLIGRVFLAISLLAFLISRFTSLWTGAGVALLFFVGIGLFSIRNLATIYGWFEKRFLQNLNEKEILEIEKQKLKPILAPWDAHLEEISIPPESKSIGRSLIDLGLKESLGVSIALIERGQRQILAPDRNEILMAHDRIHLIGTDSQIRKAQTFLSESLPISQNSDFALESLDVSETNPLVGKSLRESGLREMTGGMVVGIERNGERILNPDSNLKIENFDRLWIVGDREKIKMRRNF